VFNDFIKLLQRTRRDLIVNHCSREHNVPSANKTACDADCTTGDQTTTTVYCTGYTLSWPGVSLKQDFLSSKLAKFQLL